MTCKCLKCKHNYLGACLRGADLRQREEAEKDVDRWGYTLFQTVFEISESGACANMETLKNVKRQEEHTGQQRNAAALSVA
jgi:hypothetical protein